MGVGGSTYDDGTVVAVNARERQVQGLLQQQAIEEFEREAQAAPRELQVRTADLDAKVNAICAEQGHVWRGRRCANCRKSWEPGDT